MKSFFRKLAQVVHRVLEMGRYGGNGSWSKRRADLSGFGDRPMQQFL